MKIQQSKGKQHRLSDVSHIKVILEGFLFICACVWLMCTHMCVLGFLHPCLQISLEEYKGCFSQSLLLYFVDAVSHWPWSSRFWLGGLSCKKALGICLSHFLMSWVLAHVSMSTFLCGCCRTKAILLLSQCSCLLSHLPSSLDTFLNECKNILKEGKKKVNYYNQEYEIR